MGGQKSEQYKVGTESSLACQPRPRKTAQTTLNGCIKSVNRRSQELEVKPHRKYLINSLFLVTCISHLSRLYLFGGVSGELESEACEGPMFVIGLVFTGSACCSCTPGFCVPPSRVEDGFRHYSSHIKRSCALDTDKQLSSRENSEGIPTFIQYLW